VKSNGTYVIPPRKGPKLARLFGRYGMEERRGDVGDVEAVPATVELF
jgi:hypothetical protein